MKKSTVRVSTTAQSTSSPEIITTPSGYDKDRRDVTKVLIYIVMALLLRDVTKFLLLIVMASLLSNAYYFAAFTSAATTILIMKQGTIFSREYTKWSIVSIISLIISLTVMIVLQGSDIVDEEKAYLLKSSFYLWAKFLQISWSIILGLFLLSNFLSTS